MSLKSSKWLVMISFLIIVALALGACGAPATPAPATSAPATQPPAAQATATTAAPVATPTAAAKKAGDCGSLRILYWQAATILNTHLAQGTKDYDAGRLVLEPLAAIPADGKPVAVLAAEVPTVENGGVAKDFSSVTWKLKQGVKWSDGSDFTSDDVVFTWKYVTDDKTAATDSGTFDNVKSVDAVDKYTVKVTWKDANPNFYEVFTTGLGNILQKKQFEPFIGEKAKDGPNLKPIGTGPFMVREMKPNDVVTYDMNPNYRDFAKGKPCFKEVTFKGGDAAASSAKAVFQTGETDYAWNLQVEASVLVPMAQAADSKGILVTATSPNLERLLLQRTDVDPSLGDKRGEPPEKGGRPHPFLSDLKVRQALKLAIDTTEMAKQLYGPAGDGTCHLFSTPPNIVDTTPCPKADIDAANKLLDEAGWTKGSDGIRHKTVGGKDVKMNIVYQTTVNALRQKEQAFVKDAWEKLGVKVELKSVNAGVFFSSDEANPDTAAKFWTDVEMFTNGPESPDPTNYLKGWTCKEIKTKDSKWSGNNYERWCKADYDKLYDQLTKETDSAKRATIVKQMAKLIEDDVVIIPLVARKSVSGYAKTLKGVAISGWDSEMWNIADWTK